MGIKTGGRVYILSMNQTRVFNCQKCQQRVEGNYSKLRKFCYACVLLIKKMKDRKLSTERNKPAK